MIKKLLFSLLCSSLCTTIHVKAQTAKGGCTTVQIVNMVPYDSKLIDRFAITKTINPCQKMGMVLGRALPRFWLERKDGTTWTNTSSGGIDAIVPNFGNLPHGTYRIKIKIPVIYKSVSCPGGIAYIDNNGSTIGYQATLSAEAYYTNEVIVGATVPSDLSDIVFIDGDGRNMSLDGYDYGERVTMSTEGSKNYDTWTVAIEERTGTRRWMGEGWRNGRMPGDKFDLSNLWKNGGAQPSWEFILYGKYNVLFEAHNSACYPTWNERLSSFYICPNGTGCKWRTQEQKANQDISCNVENGTLRLFQIDLQSENYHLELYAMDGRRVKAISNLPSASIDISDLSEGIYIVNLYDSRQRVYSGRVRK